MKNKRRNKSRVFLIILIIIGLFSCTAYFVYQHGINAVNKSATSHVAKDKRFNILLLGSDARPGEANARSDTMILACVDTGLKKVALISIPRDSKVDMPGGLNKINSANALGGPEAACRSVENLMNTKVDYYVLANFNGFAKIIDILGGININVEKRMYKPSEGINLRPGVQHLDGKNALAYVRFRSDALGDIGRTGRQQKFLTALAQQLYNPKSILEIPSLIPELKSNVRTNLHLNDMLDLVSMVSQFKKADVISQTLPGYFYNDPENGLSYWAVDNSKIDNLIDNLFKGQKVAVIEDPPQSVVESEKVSVQKAAVLKASNPSPNAIALNPNYQNSDESNGDQVPNDMSDNGTSSENTTISPQSALPQDTSGSQSEPDSSSPGKNQIPQDQNNGSVSPSINQPNNSQVETKLF